MEFRDCDFGYEAKKTLSISNLTRNQVEYEWRFKDTSYEEYFEIEPKQGSFMALEEKEFEVTFKANSYVAKYPEIELFIKNIPLLSVKNPP